MQASSRTKVKTKAELRARQLQQSSWLLAGQSEHVRRGRNGSSKQRV